MDNYYFLGLADQTTGFNANDCMTAQAVKDAQKQILFVCPKRNFMQEETVDGEMSFSEMLKREDVVQIKRYIQSHRLDACEEYQMIVTLAMALDDDSIAEKIICGYIRRYGLTSFNAKQVLKSLGYEKTLETLKKAARRDDEDEETMMQVSVEKKLQDGFQLMHRDDAAEVPLAVCVYLNAEAQA